MVCQIQKFLSEGCSYREIAKRMGVGRNTIAKYREGDPKELSMYGIRQSKLDIFYDFIIQCLDSGWSKSKTIKSFAEGLKRDIDAGENAVAYDYSNGFVEGTDSRLKMIKQTIYGRCRKRLLEAKLKYVGKFRNG